MRPVLWHSAALNSFQYFTLHEAPDDILLAGTVLARLDGEPAKISYEIICDPAWRTRRVVIQQAWAGETRSLRLTVDEEQSWHSNGATIPALSGLFDIDLNVAPSTNTLPVRRHALKVGESVETTAAWVQFPALTLEPLPQKYTRVSETEYAYEAPSLDFTAQITVDGYGVVVTYGDLWQRV